ncbi:hypothetical protein DFH11DRAFT_245224, partial [Phellopilus nigrolimitatus]
GLSQNVPVLPPLRYPCDVLLSRVDRHLHVSQGDEHHRLLLPHSPPSLALAVSANPLKLDPSSPSTLTPPSQPLCSLLTRPLLSISAYAPLSLLDIAYNALQPVFYSTPRALGGLGLEPHAIGNALAVLGLSNGVFQAFCFPRMIKAWGVRKTYLVGIASAAPVFVCFPAMSAVVRMEERAALQTREEPALSAPLLVMLAFQLLLTLLLNT